MNVLVLVRFCRRIRAHRAIGVAFVIGMLLVSVLGNATCFYVCDGAEQGIGMGDALWYSIISITTIGYGDLSAVSPGARLGTIIFIVLIGLSTFSVFLGMTIDWVTEMGMKGRRGMGNVIAKDHVLLINVPSETRVRQLIDELLADPQHGQTEIVVISSTLESFVHEHERVLFVRGSILERETYLRASAEFAKMAIVLATSYEDPNSDAVVASAISVIDSIREDIHIVAECLNAAHARLFTSVHCDAIVYSMDISGKLLAQEAQDPGVSQLVDVLTSNAKGTTLYSTAVEDPLPAMDYKAFAKRLLDADVNLLSVNRGIESLTSFQSVQPQTGDRLIYCAVSRLPWSELAALAGP